ncbi:DUF4145 domain-containing protein [Helicobacter pullorum]|uniref:DUF4145 domain-containing protein n=1 Tax=Helicobacter pullorum TaxID=35818 RepID=UPI00320B35D6
MNNTYEKPEFNKEAFNCPFCGVYAKMDFANFSNAAWQINSSIDRIILKFAHYITKNEQFDINQIKNRISNYGNIVPILSICHKCNKVAIWVDEKMIYPKPRLTPIPNEDLDDALKADYEEASNIVQDSPRGACALLRLVLQKLLIDLGEDKNINKAIRNLMDKKEIDEKLQKALDSVRVIGNSAVHPNELDLRDDVDTALALFGIINYIADKMISSKKKIDEIYNLLPENTKR